MAGELFQSVVMPKGISSQKKKNLQVFTLLIYCGLYTLTSLNVYRAKQPGCHFYKVIFPQMCVVKHLSKLIGGKLKVINYNDHQQKNTISMREI